MKIAFISGPYRATNGKTILENIRHAEKYAIKYWRLGYAVICPHLNSAFMDGICKDESFLNGDKEFINRMNKDDIMVMIPGWKLSSGAVDEKSLAIDIGVKIVYEP